MKGKKEEMRIPMKFEEAVADFLKVKPVQKPKTQKPPKKKPKKS
jgi:hypothetical protein